MSKRKQKKLIDVVLVESELVPYRFDPTDADPRVCILGALSRVAPEKIARRIRRDAERPGLCPIMGNFDASQNSARRWDGAGHYYLAAALKGIRQRYGVRVLFA